MLRLRVDRFRGLCGRGITLISHRKGINMSQDNAWDLPVAVHDEYQTDVVICEDAEIGEYLSQLFGSLYVCEKHRR